MIQNKHIKINLFKFVKIYCWLISMVFLDLSLFPTDYNFTLQKLLARIKKKISKFET